MSQTHTFYLQGMHCKACELLTKQTLEEQAHISCANCSLVTGSLEVVGEFGEKSSQEIAEELTKTLEKHGYAVALEKSVRTPAWREFFLAVPLALGLLLIFALLQMLGIVNLVNTSHVTYGTAFVIGVIASLSSCMAVVGGLVLSLSATFVQHGASWKPHALFHGGRLVTFFALGGLIGALGSLWRLGMMGTLVLGLIVAGVMLLLGLQLLDIFSFTKKLSLTMPKALSQKALRLTKFNSTFTPLLAGLVTFILPCGFTQSMQVYTLSTGSFLAGGFTMLAFALGTFPVLALMSFGAFRFQGHPQAGVFFKTAGLLVVAFALFNGLNSLVAAGILQPFLSF